MNNVEEKAAGIINADLVIESNDRTVKDPSIVADYNMEKAAGYSDWQVDVPKSLLGRKIEEDDDVLNAGEVYLNILKVDGNKLYVGEASKEVRPTELEEIYFTRVNSEQ